jgi:hypothetical protein
MKPTITPPLIAGVNRHPRASISTDATEPETFVEAFAVARLLVSGLASSEIVAAAQALTNVPFVNFIPVPPDRTLWPFSVVCIA